MSSNTILQTDKKMFLKMENDNDKNVSLVFLTGRLEWIILE